MLACALTAQREDAAQREQPLGTGLVEDGGLVVRCTGVDINPLRWDDNLRCRFSNNVEVPAEYNAEQQCVSCRPPATKVCADDPTCANLSYEVITADGNTLVARLLSQSEVERPACCLQLGGDSAARDGFNPDQSLFLEVDHNAKGDPGNQSPAPHTATTAGAELSGKAGGLWPFVIITISYLLFTVTDGAVRMIVLMHAYSMGFTAMETAIMFSMYELAGVATNFLAGVAGARWGIRSTLITGLCLQLAGIGMLFGWQTDWSKLEAIVFVTAAQMLCGIAKDLTKLGGKTVTKLVTPEEKQGRLFKLVSFITGFKNSLKGAGYFLGSILLTASYYAALGVLLGFIVVALPFAIFGLSKQLGRTRKENISVRAAFRTNHNVGMLSLSRVFLFGSRDLWFEVPLPFFMRDVVYGLGWSRASVGAALAAFIIIYGQVQSWTPQLVTQPLRQTPPNKWAAALWCAILSIVPTYMGIVLLLPLYDAHQPSGPRVATLIPGLVVFAFVFAVNSSIHSYLIVRYCEGDKVAQTVGIYYCSNAVGRLVGTLLSGALYSYVGADVSVGFASCFLASLIFAVISAAVDFLIRDNKGGLSCGPCVTCCVPMSDEQAATEAQDAAPTHGLAVGSTPAAGAAGAHPAVGVTPATADSGTVGPEALQAPPQHGACMSRAQGQTLAGSDKV